MLLAAMALCAGAALVLSFLHWKDWKARKQGQGAGPMKRALTALLTALNKLRNRFRRKLTPGEIHRLEQRSRTPL